MADPTTRIGDARVDFTATAWSQLVLRRDAGPEERQRRVELLARRYWKPIYAYIRRRWNRPNEEAKDLTQKFFLWMLETDFLEKVRADRGRFRNFVKKAVERFVLGEYDAERRLKRGGGTALVSLDFIGAGAVEAAAPALDPEALFEEQWRRVLVQEALARLRSALESAGKLVPYRIFEDFYFAPEPGPSYEDLAARHGVSKVDVANALARVKARYRAILEELLAESVAGPAELRQEFRELFGEGP